ncbi:MAG: hypothetical protein HY712_04365 [candidate division NC10 bacterium]|nr:hypothetical protein [candidate division NC10 bacterium]
MPTLDTRLPWEAIEAVASPDPLAELLNGVRHLTPRERLTRHLDAWTGMDEAAWSEANVKALHEDIMDIFRDHPREADGWFREWRRAHPGARLA